MTEPPSFAYLAGHTTEAEYCRHRDAIFKARRTIIEILLHAKRRLAKAGPGAAGAFGILRNLITEYYRELNIMESGR